MATLPTLPEFVTFEHDVARILTKQELHGWFFDFDAARQLASLSEQSFDTLKSYFAIGILTSKDHDLLLSEITAALDMLKERPSLASKN